jgi:hypothetical protein
MSPEKVQTLLPNPSPQTFDRGRLLHHLVTSQRLPKCILLTSYTDPAAAFIAAAIDDLGEGSLLLVDTKGALRPPPQIEAVFESLGLSRFATHGAESRSLNWHLMKVAEETPLETFDFGYINCRTWRDAGFAYSVLSRLLNPGAWMTLCGLDFTFRASPSRKHPRVLALSEEEQTLPQVRKVFDLLVQRDPAFTNFRETGHFGFAQKRAVAGLRENPESQKVEIAVCRAIERAHADPDFRFALLDDPSGQLSALSGVPASSFHGIRFDECDAPYVRFDYATTSNGRIYHLELPKWGRMRKEAYYLDLLQGDESQNY